MYELVLRSLDQQERELVELRSRTNTVIAAAALIASFLAAATIRQHNGLGPLPILALVVLLVTGGLSLYVLWPRELRSAIDARATYEGSLHPARRPCRGPVARRVRGSRPLHAQQEVDRPTRARLPSRRAHARRTDGLVDACVAVAEAMADTNKPAPAPRRRTRSNHCLRTRSFRRSAAMEPRPRKTSNDPTRPTSDANAVISDAPGTCSHASSVSSGTSTRPAEGAPGIRLQEQGRDLTPQEWKDLIRQHASAMLPPDGEG